MYCVKCGRRAHEGEKRCPACGMRLVTPARLNQLLDERRAQRSQTARAKPDYAAQAQTLLRQVSEKLDGVIAEVRERSTPRLEKLRAEILELKAQRSPELKKLRRKFRKLRRRARKFWNQVKPEIKPERAETQEHRHVKVKRTQPKQRESFTERNLRTIVAMSLLGLTLLVVLIWGTVSEPGQRTFASLGLGSANGYILLGDEYMSGSNYLRAVESYYTALNKTPSFEAAFKLARAYSYTGDMDKCVSALLYCTDNYPGRREPYVQLIAIYPDAGGRPDKVKAAIAQGNAQFNLE